MLRMSLRSGAGQDLDKEMAKQMEELSRGSFRDQAGQIYAGQLAAGKDELAAKVAAKAREYDPSPAMTSSLVTMALKAGQPRKEQREWLIPAKEPSHEALSKRLNEALEKKPTAK